MNSTTITVPKPTPIDGGVLDELFSRSRAISDAVSRFWQLGLSSKAELGEVVETEDAFNVKILYQA